MCHKSQLELSVVVYTAQHCSCCIINLHNDWEHTTLSSTSTTHCIPFRVYSTHLICNNYLLLHVLCTVHMGGAECWCSAAVRARLAWQVNNYLQCHSDYCASASMKCRHFQHVHLNAGNQHSTLRLLIFNVTVL